MQTASSTYTPSPRTIDSAGTEAAWFYGRYSDDELQDKDSLDQQLRASREDARKADHFIPEELVYTDPGYLGSDPERPALLRMLHDIEHGDVKCNHLYVFDTSRLARDEELSARYRKFFNFFKVTVHFVSSGINSGNVGSDIAQMFMAAADATFSKTLGKNVGRAHADLFEKGFVACSRTYGYRNLDKMPLDRLDSFDRSAREGVLHEILEPEAQVVRMIFRLYLAGMGYQAIARHLNDLGIKPPQRKRKNPRNVWCESGPRQILKQERYVGCFRHRTTETTRHPLTNKVVVRKRPKEEWLEKHYEHLRIISDEDFAAVVKLRASRDMPAAQRKAAGLNRAKKVHVWSGLLHCGECHGPVSICQPGTYMCSGVYHKSGCRNSFKLRTDALEQHLMELLTKSVLKSTTLEELVKPLLKEARRQQFEQQKTAFSSATRRVEQEKALRQVTEEAQGIVALMIQLRDSTTLKDMLAQKEAQKALLEQACSEPIAQAYQLDEKVVRGFLETALADLANILTADLSRCRTELHKRVDRLELHSIEFENTRGLRIAGDVRLFSNVEPKMLGLSRSIEAKHLDFKLGLDGTIIKLEPNGKILRMVLPSAVSTEVSMAA